MADEKMQLIAMVPEAAAMTTPQEIQTALENNLERKYEFQQRRFLKALAYSATATASVFVILLVAFGLYFFRETQPPERYRLHAVFIDWSSSEKFDVCTWYCEAETQVKRALRASVEIGASFIADERDYFGNTAGIARLCTLIAVSVVVWSTYRKMLPEYYEINGQPAQQEDFRKMNPWLLLGSRALYTAASLFGTYVMVSITWFGLAVVFKDVIINQYNAAIIVLLFTGGVTFGAAYGALVANTRTVLLLGLATFLFGFAASFALSPLVNGKQWWESAVSNAGQLNPSAPLFTGTLVSGSMALAVMWFDLNNIIDRLVGDGKRVLLARILYGCLILGLVSVAIVRVDDNNFPGNKAFHAGGAVLAIFGVIGGGIAIWVNQKRFPKRFPPWYILFSILIIVATLLMAVFGSLRFYPPPVGFVATGTGVISLTVIELTLFILMGLWIYFTVDNLLAQANIHALKGTVVVVAQQANPAPAAPSGQQQRRESTKGKRRSSRKKK